MNNFHNIKIRKLHIFFLWCSLILLTLYSFSCEAPHSNPLDPFNPGNNLGTIQGVVQTFSLPFTGIADVSVYWPSANILVKSDQNGKFSINNVPIVNGILIFQKEGYRTDSVIINWGGSRTIKPQVNLNSMPVLDSILIFTSVINQYFPNQTFELDVLAKVMDKDNDIDSVSVENAQLNLSKKLSFNISQNYFQTSVTPAEMNISDLEQAIGLDFNIVAYDRFKNSYHIGSGKVTRVIKSPINVIAPANSDTVSSNPVLSWQKFQPGYSFNYTVEVYTNDFANSQIVFSQSGVSSDSTTFFVKNPLPPKNYYWVLWVMDQFQNRARSKPATFTVK